MLHNSNEFLPFVIYLRPPPVENDPEAILEQNGEDVNGDHVVDNNEEETMLPKEIAKRAWVRLHSTTYNYYISGPKFSFFNLAFAILFFDKRSDIKYNRKFVCTFKAKRQWDTLLKRRESLLKAKNNNLIKYTTFASVNK